MTNDDGSVISNNATMHVYGEYLCRFSLVSSHVRIMYVGPPSITFISNHTVSLRKRKVHLICSAINDSKAIHPLQINWYFEKQLVIQNRRITIHNETDTTSGQLKSTLQIDPVNPSDHGVYTCRALNHHDSYFESRTDLTVQCTVH